MKEKFSSGMKTPQKTKNKTNKHVNMHWVPDIILGKISSGPYLYTFLKSLHKYIMIENGWDCHLETI